jgi:hypothetical protein
MFCPELPAYLAKNVVAVAIAHAAQGGLTNLDALTRAGIRALTREVGRQMKRESGRRRGPKASPQRAA